MFIKQNASILIRYFLQINLMLVLCCLTIGASAQTSIAGNITQSFSAGAAGKPDEGSKIFVLKYEGDAIALYETINNFLLAKKMKSLNSAVPRVITLYKDSADVIKNKRKFEEKYAAFQNTIAKIKSEEAERLAILQTMDADTNTKFDMLDQRTSKAISQIKLKAFDSKTVTSVDGNFSLNTAAGKNIVLVISNNRTGLSSSELSGKIFVQLVDVNDGEKVTINYKFYPD